LELGRDINEIITQIQCLNQQIKANGMDRDYLLPMGPIALSDIGHDPELQIKCGDMFERCFVGIKDKCRICEIS
jgi:hypothetical protein